MPYTPKKHLNNSQNLNWRIITLVGVLTFISSVFLGRWFGTKILQSHTNVTKSPPSLSDYSQVPTTPNTETYASQAPRQDISPPPLVVPPPALGSGQQTDLSNTAQPNVLPISPAPTTTMEREPEPSASPSQPPSLATEPFKGTGRYKVQAGIFANPDNAKDLIRHLREQGYASSFEEIPHPDGTYYRVTIGPYDTREEAQSIAQQLTATGYQAFVLGESPVPNH